MRPHRFLALLVVLTIASMVSAEDTATATPAHGLAMHGDLKYPADFPHFDYVVADAPKGGAMVQHATGTYDSFNPFIVRGASASGGDLIYDTLLVHAADEPFSAYGLLAESVATPADRSWVTFVLRKDARWHDGKPVTADDVIWSFDILRSKGLPHFRAYYADVERAERLDERTIKFVFKPGVNRELPLILGDLVVLPQHYWESRDFDKTTLEPPLGSGPYKISRFDSGHFVEYERVADYWGAKIPVNVGRWNFATIRFNYFRDSNVATEAFKAGAYDLRLENASKTWATHYDIPPVRDGRVVKRTSPHNRPQGMQAFFYNSRRSIFADRTVRHALAYAFDFEWSNKNLFYGQYVRTRSYFDNSELAATGLPSEAESVLLEPHRAELPPQVFTEEYQPPSTDGSGQNRDNLRRAVKMLDSAGWKVDAKTRKLTHAEYGAMTFEILLWDPQFERIVLPFTKSLERLGIDASVRIVDTAQYIRRLEDFDFDMIVSGFGVSASPGNELRGYWGSRFAEEKGSRNHIGIRDSVVDGLIEQVIAAPDRKSLVDRVRALDRVLQWGHWLIPHWHIDYDRLVYWNKFGMPDVVPDSGVQILGTWWVDPAKEAALGRRGSTAESGTP